MSKYVRSRVHLSRCDRLTTDLLAHLGLRIVSCCFRNKRMRLKTRAYGIIVCSVAEQTFVAIVAGAGSAVGIVLLLILVVSATSILLCFWLRRRKKHQAYFAPTYTGAQTDSKSSDDITVMSTTINAAYKSSQPPLQLDVVYDTANKMITKFQINDQLL